MSRMLKIWLCVIATALTILFASQALVSRRAIAQQPPPPNPPPGPAETCCELLTPGGNTIGGPGVYRYFPGDSVDFDSNIIFLALGPQDACITLTNTGPFPLRFNMTDRSDEVRGLNVEPGRTKILCVSKTNLARVNCDGPSGRGCSYRWRVDKPL